MKTSVKTKKAFTLVELLVVIGIIMILTGIMVTNITGSRAKARDGKRISDLSQLQLALNLYYDRCKQYPLPVSNKVAKEANNCNAGSGAISLGDYISTIPNPPASPGFTSSYDYFVDTTTGTPSDYVLHTRLENANEIVKDGRQNPPSWASAITCDSTVNYCLGPR